MASLFPSGISSYRGRLAPSPTGYLHVGHARTFWTAWQRARDAAGTLILRMEDLDPDRSRAVYADAAMEDLRWLGIRWQEGPDKGGPHGPYVQSRRKSTYLAVWRELYRRGSIYPCHCSRKDLEGVHSAPHERPEDQLDDEPVYPGLCRPDSSVAGPAAVPDTPNGVNWRFRVPDGKVVEFVDLNLGPQRFVAGRDFGDFVVWRLDGVPSYQLACVADDAAMGITEVVRGADLLKSTARQILLNESLGFRNPEWFHCNLVVDHHGRRLAKRHDSLSLRSLRQRGVTPMNIFAAELPIGV